MPTNFFPIIMLLSHNEMSHLNYFSAICIYFPSVLCIRMHIHPSRNMRDTGMDHKALKHKHVAFGSLDIFAD